MPSRKRMNEGHGGRCEEEERKKERKSEENLYANPLLHRSSHERLRTYTKFDRVYVIGRFKRRGRRSNYDVRIQSDYIVHFLNESGIILEIIDQGSFTISLTFSSIVDSVVD